MPVGVPHRCSGPDFLVKEVDIPVVVPGRCSGPDVQNHFVNKEVDMPSVVPHRCPGPASQKTVEVPLLQFFDKDSDMPVVVRCPYIQVVRVPRVPSWREQLCSHSCTC